MSRVGASLVLALWLMAIGTQGAAAHAYLISTDPADGAALGTAPTSAHLTFSEDVISAWSVVDLVGRDGTRLSATIPDVGATRTLEIQLPKMGIGTYRLDWQTVSADDYHVTDGTIVFGVGRDAAGAGTATTSAAGTDPEEAFFGAAATGALILLVGGIGLWLSLWWRTSVRAEDEPARRILSRRVVGAAAIASVVALVVSFAEHVARPLPAGAVSSTAPMAVTAGFLLRIGALLALGMLLAPTWRAMASSAAPRGRILPGVALGLAVVVIVARTLGSHAAAGDGRPLGLLMGSVHVIAAGIWVGGVAILGLLVVPVAWRRPELRKTALGALRAFGVLAIASLAMLGATGLVLMGRLVTSPDALLTSPYGQLLIAKLGLVGIAAAAGLVNAATMHEWARRPVVASWARLTRRRIRPRPSWTRPLIVLELAAALTAVLVAGVLAATAPANGPEFRAASEDVPPPPVVKRVDDLILSAAVRPDRPGANFVTVEVLDTRRPSPGRVERVTVVLQSAVGGGSVVRAEARQISDQRWEVAGIQLERAGAWSIRTVVERADLPAATLDARWRVKPAIAPVPRRPTVVSDARIAPVANVAAVLLTLSALGIGVRAFRRRRKATARAVLRSAASPHSG